MLEKVFFLFVFSVGFKVGLCMRVSACLHDFKTMAFIRLWCAHVWFFMCDPNFSERLHLPVHWGLTPSLLRLVDSLMTYTSLLRLVDSLDISQKCRWRESFQNEKSVFCLTSVVVQPEFWETHPWLICVFGLCFIIFLHFNSQSFFPCFF